MYNSEIFELEKEHEYKHNVSVKNGLVSRYIFFFGLMTFNVPDDLWSPI